MHLESPVLFRGPQQEINICVSTRNALQIATSEERNRRRKGKTRFKHSWISPQLHRRLRGRKGLCRRDGLDEILGEIMLGTELLSVGTGLSNATQGCRGGTGWQQMLLRPLMSPAAGAGRHGLGGSPTAPCPEAGSVLSKLLCQPRGGSRTASSGGLCTSGRLAHRCSSTTVPLQRQEGTKCLLLWPCNQDNHPSSPHLHPIF